MGTFKTFNMSNSSLQDYYKYNNGVPYFFETSEYIYINGEACDKKSLSSVGLNCQLKANVSGIEVTLSPMTTTRYFNRYIGDATRHQFVNPYSPKNTLLAKDIKLSNGTTMLAIPSTTCDATNSDKSNSTVLINKNGIISDYIPYDSYNFIPFIIPVSDTKYYATKCTITSRIERVSQNEPSLYQFDLTTKTKTNISINTYGDLISVFYQDAANIYIFSTTNNFTGTTSSSYSVNVGKINKSTGTYTTIATAVTSNLINYYPQVYHSFIDKGSTIELYCINPNGLISCDATKGGTSFPIVKIVFTKSTGSASVPSSSITVNYNGLASALKMVCNYTAALDGASSSLRTSKSCGIIFTSLTVNSCEYLVVSNVSNKAYLNYASSSGALNSTYTVFKDSSVEYNTNGNMFIYLFKVNASSLDLVDLMHVGNTKDLPQAVFPANNDSNLIVVRYSGIETYTINTTTNKFAIKDSISEEIYSLGIDELERVWYVTSIDGMTKDVRMKVFSVGDVYECNVAFDSSSYQYSGTDIGSSISINVTSASGSKVVKNVVLTLTGKAIFTDNDKDTITITTDSVSSVSVPIKIFGTGGITVSTNIQ